MKQSRLFLDSSFFQQAIKFSKQHLGIDVADFLERRRAWETKGTLCGRLGTKTQYLKYCVFGV